MPEMPVSPNPSEPARYRKKPVEIEAVRFDGSNRQRVLYYQILS